MSVVLECPVCSSAFQVLPENAGQLVACPNCKEAVAVPDEVGAVAPEPIPMAAPSAPIVFSCGSCSGKFGVTPDMDGTHVACPHCQEHVVVEINAPSAPSSPFQAPSTSSEPIIPKIRTGRKKKKKIISFVDPTDPPANVPPASQPADRVPPARVDVGPKSKKKSNKKWPEPPQDVKKKPDVSRTFDDSEEVGRDSDMLPPKKAKQIAKPPAKPKPAAKPESKPAAKAKSKTAPSKKSKSKNKSRQASKSKQPDSTEDKKAEENSAAVVKPSESTEPTESTEHTTETAESTETPELTEAEIAAQEAIAAEAVALIDRRLPPKFSVEDPDEHLQSNLPSAQDHEVILPDGEGGYTRVDSRYVHVERDGEVVQLKAPTRESKAFNRMVQNFFSIGLGILILALAFWILIAW